MGNVLCLSLMPKAVCCYHPIASLLHCCVFLRLYFLFIYLFCCCSGDPGTVGQLFLLPGVCQDGRVLRSATTALHLVIYMQSFFFFSHYYSASIKHQIVFSVMLLLNSHSAFQSLWHFGIVNSLLGCKRQKRKNTLAGCSVSGMKMRGTLSGSKIHNKTLPSLKYDSGCSASEGLCQKDGPPPHPLFSSSSLKIHHSRPFLLPPSAAPFEKMRPALTRLLTAFTWLLPLMSL